MKVFLGILGAAAALYFGWVVLLIVIGNELVTEREDIDQTWAQVQNVYQRRADLIPNLVNTVKGYAAHEKGVFEAVTTARSKVGSVTIDPQKMALDPKAQEAYLNAQKELGSALSRLIAVSEAYPNLKASDVYVNLMSQLEGTENRITSERRKNQLAINAFNAHIQRWPAEKVAKERGFERLPYFEAKPSAQEAPTVTF